jgi:hypothetical protein
MGASGWAYFVPFQVDIAKVLQKLRDEVFQRGDYFKPDEFYSALLDSEVAENLPLEVRDSLEEQIEEMRSRSEPDSIEELIEMSAESGTHSILDIKGISNEPDFGTAAPLTDEELVQLFGTTKPTKSIVEGKISEIQLLRSSWQGTYIVLYEDKMPKEILFAGFSGD